MYAVSIIYPWPTMHADHMIYPWSTMHAVFTIYPWPTMHADHMIYPWPCMFAGPYNLSLARHICWVPIYPDLERMPHPPFIFGL